MTVWIDDGIIHIQAKGVASTPETMTETFTVVHDLTDGEPRPALFDARTWPTWPAVDREVWATFISGALPAFSAAAVIVDPASPPQSVAFPETIDRLMIPFRIFTDEAEALAFLRGDT